MPLVKDGRLTIDPWISLGDEAPPANHQDDIIVSLERWRRDALLLRRHGGGLGLRLRSDQLPSEIAADLEVFALIALEFPKFGDGRAFSTARLLRERYGFAGEIRAIGDVLRDQFLFMHRCGFDSFEVESHAAAEAWCQSVSEITVFYQPGGLGNALPLAERKTPAVAANLAN